MDDKRRRPEPDYVLILAVAALVLLGLLMVFSTTLDWGYARFGDPLRFLKRQLLWLVLGVGVATVLARTDYHRWQTLAVPILGLTLVLLVLVLVFGEETMGARRSFLSGSIQPGELAKLAVVIYAAAWSTSKGEQIRDVNYGLIPFATWMGIVAGLVALQPDLSTVAILILGGLSVFFLAGAHLGQLFATTVLGGMVFSGLILAYPHARSRLEAFVVGLKDPTNLPYHPQQALYALANGGLIGTRLGEGRMKFYLPASHTDAIFAVLGEELGLVGCLLVIGLFAVLAWRGYRIAVRAQDAFGSLLACGLTSLLVSQAVLNIGVIASLLPFTGTNLPFISLGGSSLAVSLAAVGLLLSVGRGHPPRVWRKETGESSARLDRRRRNGGTCLPRTGRPGSA